MQERERETLTSMGFDSVVPCSSTEGTGMTTSSGTSTGRQPKSKLMQWAKAGTMAADRTLPAHSHASVVFVGLDWNNLVQTRKQQSTTTGHRCARCVCGGGARALRGASKCLTHPLSSTFLQLLRGRRDCADVATHSRRQRRAGSGAERATA